MVACKVLRWFSIVGETVDQDNASNPRRSEGNKPKVSPYQKKAMGLAISPRRRASVGGSALSLSRWVLAEWTRSPKSESIG
jgi:hypothetical protein